MYKTALANTYKAIRTALKAANLPVGETAGYPRVEIHSLTEDTPTDKGDKVRNISLIVESMHAHSYAGAVALNSAVCVALVGQHPAIEGGKILYIESADLTEAIESNEANGVLYRQIQRLNIIVES